MAKKSKPHRPAKANAQKPRRRSAGPAGARGAASVERRRRGALVLLEHHREPFLAWARASDPPDEVDLEVLWHSVESVVDYAAEVVGLSDPARWTPDLLDDLLDVLDGEEPGVAGPLLSSLSVFFDQLADTGAWRGAPGDLVVCTEMLDDALGAGGDVERVLEEALATDPELEGAALALLPLFGPVAALLTWVGQGRAVAEDDPLPVEAPGAPVLEGAVSLAHLWRTCAVAGLLEVGEGTARVSGSGRVLLGGSETDETGETRLATAVTWVVELLTDPGPDRDPGLGPALGTVLVWGMDAEPLALAELSEAVLDVVPQAPPDQVEAGEAALREHVGQLAAAGLVALDAGHVVVPVALRRVVALAVSSAAQIDAQELQLPAPPTGAAEVSSGAGGWPASSPAP